MRAILFSARFNSSRDWQSSRPWMDASRLSPRSMKHSSVSPEQSTCSIPLHWGGKLSEINDHTNCIMTTPTLYNYHTQHIVCTCTNCPMTAPTCIDISLICPLPDIPDKNATPHLVRERERRRGHRERQRRSTGALLR